MMSFDWKQLGVKCFIISGTNSSSTRRSVKTDFGNSESRSMNESVLEVRPRIAQFAKLDHLKINS
jgi:hypothetical protein